MNNFPPAPYPDQNPPAQPGYPQPGGFYQPTEPAFPPQQPGQPGNFPQPGTFAQPGYAPASPPKKRRTGLWITLAVILLLLLVGGGIFTYLQVRSTPQKTLQAYCTALVNDDAQAVYATYSSEAQAQVSLDTVKTELRIIDLLVGGIKQCVVQDNSIQENGSLATGKITVTLGRGGSGDTTVQLIDENSQWKVQKNARLPGSGNTP